VNQEADARDDEDHHDGKLVHLKIEARTKIPSHNPVEKFFPERVPRLCVVAEEFADGFDRHTRTKVPWRKAPRC